MVIGMQPAKSSKHSLYIPPLDARNVVLGVTGSIAAYKAADLASKLVQAGANVEVIMSTSAAKFIGKSTFAALTHNKVTTGLWEATSELNINHVALALRADCLLIAPATANTLAKLALVDSDSDILSFNSKVSSFLSDTFSISKIVYQPMYKK